MAFFGAMISLGIFVSPGEAQQENNTSRMYAAVAKLYELHFWTGQSYSPSDDDNKQAIIAFQKLSGLSRTGHLGDSTYNLLMQSKGFTPKETMHKEHVEVDLDKQVLFLVDSSGSIRMILPVSTATGDKFHQEGDGDLMAKTPVGKFRVFNKIEGWKESPLGLMYDPLYFSGGYAIHGDYAVPAHPASHGCVRIPMFAAQWMFQSVPMGTSVYVYGKNPDHPDRRMAGSKPQR